MQMIIQAGAIAAAISAIIALAVMVAKFIRWIKTIIDRLDTIIDDIADLQYERLSQAHDYYVDRGWCPASKKVQLCNMYMSYTSKGRNHLSARYESEILELADSPEDLKRRKRNAESLEE